ncbi:hypothetical protein [Azonexus hydrophilus]
MFEITAPSSSNGWQQIMKSWARCAPHQSISSDKNSEIQPKPAIPDAENLEINYRRKPMFMNPQLPSADEISAFRRDHQALRAAVKLRADLSQGIRLLEPETLLSLARQYFPGEDAYASPGEVWPGGDRHATRAGCAWRRCAIPLRR